MNVDISGEQRWRKEAGRVLKSQLARHGLTYGDLVSRLKASGCDESYASVANKISRGSFSFAFYLQCLHVMERPLRENELSTITAERRVGE